MRLLFAAVPLLLLAAACGGGSDDTPPELSLAQWAAQTCSALQTFADDAAAAGDGVDPTTLTVEARVERADRLSAAGRSAALAAERALDDLRPPSAARAYHASVTARFTALVDVFDRLDAGDAATSHDDIEARNAELGIVAVRSARAIEDTWTDLPEDARSAMLSITKCG